MYKYVRGSWDAEGTFGLGIRRVYENEGYVDGDVEFPSDITSKII